MCGKNVSVSNLNAQVFNKTLEDLFSLDLIQMALNIYERLGRRHRLLGYFYNR